MVHAEGRPELFIDGRKLSNQVRDTLESVADVREARDFSARLAELGQEKRKVLYDRNGSAEAVARLIEEAGGTIVERRRPGGPCRRRGRARPSWPARAPPISATALPWPRFLRFVETSAAGSLTEIDAAKKLETLRAETAAEDGMPLDDISFDAISSTGPNGAINHYRVTERTNRSLEAGDLYLIDSGGQYRDGTTDITRTVPIGEVPRERLEPLPRPLHARAEGAYRNRHRALSQRHDRRAARPVRALRRCGRPGSTSTTAPATASAPISACTKARSASPRPATRRSSPA